MELDNNIYQLKITYLIDGKPKPYRVLEIEKHQSLTQLAEAILGSFNWDCNHCFGFYNNITNWTNSTIKYEEFVDLEDMEYFVSKNAKSPNKSTIKNAFKKTPTLLFLFDYGTEHLFKVKLVKQVDLVSSVKYPKIVESFGKLKKQ